ncbi:glycosyltransferase [Streptomyces sp. NPDC001941]|uniref:glycosyltransferase n=1 Tax=Streptomyces sp. NPDC001941 TaxID=3154659 RepID=UPI003321D520
MSTDTRPHRPVRAIAVILPAHNEQELLPAALRAVRVATGHPGLGTVRVLTVVAADSCTDHTVAVARAEGVLVVPVRHRNVGQARASAVRTAAAELGADPVCLWIASTDADSRVPPHWLAHQVARARQGWDAVVGTVTVDQWEPHQGVLADRYRRLYEVSRPPESQVWEHPHVHGANLGVAAMAYERAGGFPPVPLDEDRVLVAALVRTGAHVLRTAQCPVATSSRVRARARGGFGDHLGELAAN